VNAFLNVDAGGGIGGAETPAVVAIGSIETENVCAGMSVACAEAAGLDFGGACGVDVETRGELAVNGVADFKAVEQVLRFAGTRAGDVEIALIVLGDLGESDKAFGKDVWAGDRDVSNVAGGERVALGGILRIDLIGASCDLDLFVNFFGVVYGEGEIIGAGLQSEGAAGDDEVACFADFEFVIGRGEISQSEAAGSVGFGARDVACGVFQLNLDGGDRDAVFIEDDTGAAGKVGRASLEGRKNTEACQKRSELASERHCTPVLTGPGFIRLRNVWARCLFTFEIATRDIKL